MNFLSVQVTEIFDLNGKPQKGYILTFFISFISYHFVFSAFFR